MKKLLIMVIGILTIGATLPAIAGDDRQSDRLRNMELRKARLVHRGEEAAPPIAPMPGCPMQMMMGRMPQAPVKQ